jgi:hypothetical protein
MRLSETDDQDIKAWLDAQEDKTAAVKAAIRAAMNGTPSGGPVEGLIELGDESLAAIRAIVEAVVIEHGITGAPVEANDCDPELEAKLYSMF